MATNLVEVDEFTESVLVPEPGDDRKASSVEIPFQALANRAKYLMARSGIELPGGARHSWADAHSFQESVGFFDVVHLGGTTNEIEYANGAGVLAPRARTTRHMLRGSAFQGSGSAGGNGGRGVRLVSGPPASLSPGFEHELALPRGAVIMAWRMVCGVYPGASVRARVQMTRATPNFAGPGGGTLANEGSAVDTTGAAFEVLGATGLSVAVDDVSTLAMLMTISVMADAQYVLLGLCGIELEWLDPGPRNY